MITRMLKHPTASVFVFDHDHRGGAWRLGLIHHPRLGRWMLPGGHVEPDENPAEAALREVTEELGYSARLLPPALGDPVVPLPLVIVEQRVPPDREPAAHIHLDHLYVALAGQQVGPAELPVAWRRADELAELRMFDDTRTLAHLLFAQLDQLPGIRPGPDHG